MTGKSTRLHDRLRHILESTPGLTQRGLAERMGLNPAAVNRMLYGRRNIMAEEIPLIETYIGRKLDIHTHDMPANVYSGAGTAARGLSDVAQQPGPVSPFAAPPGSFTVYVFADDMAPRYFKGEMVQVHAGMEPEEGRDCLIEKKNGTVLLRRLLKMTDEKIRVRQYSPAGDKDIPRRDIKAVYPVLSRG